MKFLLPVGGVVDFRFGILTSPYHRGVPAGIVAGMPWAADLGCVDGPAYVKRVDVPRARAWLETMAPYRSNCLFISGLDVVGRAHQTLEAFLRYRAHFDDWPVAYVAQDGQEQLDFPASELWETLFVGGSTAWKVSSRAVVCIQRAVQQGKRIHIGRVNFWKRYRHFWMLPGSKEWTCDGTRTRFGRDKAIQAWADYMERGHTLDHQLFDSYCFGQSNH